MIINCPSLSLLVLDRNQFIEISPGAFQQMFLQYVISNDYRICCIVQAGTQCLSKSPKYKTCHKLLNNNTLKIAYITFSLIVIILNFVSFVLQKVIFNQLCHSYEMIAGSINILDLGWGLYLSIIWVAHVTYTTNYVRKDTMWLQTPFCFLAFGIALYYIILSPLSLCFLSFCRLSVVLKPFDIKMKNIKYVKKYILYMFGFGSTIVPGVTSFLWIFHSSIPFKLCYPLIDPSHSFVLIKVLVCCIVVQEFAAITFISYNYVKMVKEIFKLQAYMQSFISKDYSNMIMIIQVGFLITSNIICWVPSAIIFSLMMFLIEFSSELILWTMVAISSTNALINPILLIATAYKKIKNV